MIIKDNYITDELVIEIGRFSILWNCFERFQCNNSCNPIKIKDIGGDISVEKEKIIALANVLNNRRFLFNYSVPDYVQEGLYPKGARKSNTEEDKKLINIFLELDKGDLTVGCLLAIYRIRNNLMHGLKQIEDLNNQLDLFKAVNQVLESVKENKNVRI